MIAGYITIAEAAMIARVSSRTISRGLRDAVRPLRHFHIGRRVVIDERDLRQWVERGVVTASPASVLHPVSRSILAELGTLSAPTRTTATTSAAKTSASAVRPSGCFPDASGRTENTQADA